MSTLLFLVLAGVYLLVGLGTAIPVGRAVIKYAPDSALENPHLLGRSEQIRLHKAWTAVGTVAAVELALVAHLIWRTAPWGDDKESWHETSAILMAIITIIVLLASWLQLMFSYDIYYNSAVPTTTYARRSAWTAVPAWPAVLPGILLLGAITLTNRAVRGLISTLDPYIIGARGRAFAAREDNN